MSYQSVKIGQGPALYYRLDMVGGAANGDSIPDISGNGLHGTLAYGGTSPVPPYGNLSPIETDPASREFFCHNDPFDSFATISRTSDPLIEPSGDFTLEGWFRPENILASFMLIKQKVFDGQCFTIGVDANGRLFGTVRDTAGTTWRVTDPGFGGGQDELLQGDSYYVVLVRLGNALALYVNGALRASVTVTSGLPTLAEAGPFGITAGISGDFSFRVDEVAIFTRALTGVEIRTSYEAALSTVDVRGACNIRTSAQINGADEPDPIAYSFRHNWDQPVIERLRWRTSLFKPENGSIEFAKQRSSLRRQVEYQHLLYSEKLRRQFEARAFAGRTTLTQFEPDKVRVSSLSAGATTAAFDTRYMDFEVGHRVLIYQDDNTYEFSTLTAVDDSGVEWEDALSRDYVNPWIKPARIARLPIEQSMDAETDTVGNASTIYEYLPEDEPLVPRRIIPFTPTLTYRDHEVFDLREWQGHDYNEVPQIQYVADRSELDFETGVVTTKQYRWGAETVTPYNMNLQGRELIAKYLGWLYERAGMYSPFWMPTFRQDLEPVSAAGDDLTVNGHEYTNLYASADNRQDLAFVYFDGTYAMRQVESSTVDGDNDTLTLDSAVPTFTNLRWLCFLRRVVLASDDLEIAWETDNVVRVAFAVRDAPLDFTLGSPSVSPSPSPSLSHSPSPSHSASASTSPSGSGSPSVSTSPSRSPSASQSPSSSASPSV